MTDLVSEEDRKAAMDWLDELISMQNPVWRDTAIVIRTMLAEPRLPAEASSDALHAMRNALGGSGRLAITDEIRIYRALHAYLSAPPKPATKTVWSVLGGLITHECHTPEEAFEAIRREVDRGCSVTVVAKRVLA